MTDPAAQIRAHVNAARHNAQRDWISADEERDPRLAKLAEDVEAMADALLAVLDDHGRDAVGNCRRCAKLPPDEHRSPFLAGYCPTVLATKRALRIEV